MPKFEVSDGTAKYEIEAPDENAALTAFQQFKGGSGGNAEPKADAPKAKESEFGINEAVRAVATGVPIVGGLTNKLNAATNAALAPILNPFFDEKDQLKGEGFGDRYTESLAVQEAMDKKAAEDHPVKNTVLNVAGGVAGMIPPVLAAPKLLGATGTLPQMVKYGAGSGAGISAADAVVRGEDPTTAAVVGGITGAAAPLAGRAIGKVVDAVRPKPPAAPPVPQNVDNVVGVDIPLRSSQVSGDAAESQAEQMYLRGGGGEPAQRMAQEFDEAQQAAVSRASSKIGEDLIPGAQPGAPQVSALDAGERVAADLAAQQQAREAAAAAAEQARLATEAAQRQATAASGEQLRAGMGQGTVQAPTPFDAGDMIGAGVRRQAEAARQARTTAYDAVRDIEGEFNPKDWTNIGRNLRQRLGQGRDPIVIDDTITPLANRALNDLEENVGGLQFQNRMRPNSKTRITESGERVADPITAQDIDQARKRILSLRPDAVAKARMGQGSDLRALDAIIRGFDDRLETIVSQGKFSGDGADFLNKLREARRLHSEYRRTFSPQGPSDDVGTAIQKIVGRYEGAELRPDEVASLAYGSANEPGGGKTVRIAERMRQIFGEQSPEWAAYKQGLFAHLVDTPPGTAARTPEQIANRIEKFLGDSKGRGLADVALTPSERTALQNFAAAQRRLIPPDLPAAAIPTEIDRVMGRLSGANGGLPPTPSEVVEYLYARTGGAAAQGGRGGGLSTKLAMRLKQDLTPEAWNIVRQGMWSKINEASGAAAPGPAEMAKRLDAFLTGHGRDMARVMFTESERNNMKLLAQTYRKMIPVAGTTNPSGTAPMLAKIVDRTTNNLLSMIGAASGGFTGMAAGWAGEKVLKAAANQRAAKEATRLFYGQQPMPPARRKSARAAVAITQGATPALLNQ